MRVTRPWQGKYLEVDHGVFDFVKVIATSGMALEHSQFRLECPNPLVRVRPTLTHQWFLLSPILIPPNG